MLVVHNQLVSIVLRLLSIISDCLFAEAPSNQGLMPFLDQQAAARHREYKWCICVALNVTIFGGL
jgi:hypothetical protein